MKVINPRPRYEVAEELASIIGQEDRFEAGLTYAITKLPSYTQLGMAGNAMLHQKIVSFGFDEQHQLIEQVRHPAKHLDVEEFDLYIHVLARECDRFEYLLCGEDNF